MSLSPPVNDFLNSEISRDGPTFSRDHPARVTERVRLLARRSQDAVPGVLIGSLLMGAVLQKYARWSGVAAWIAIFIFVNSYRIYLSRRLLAGQADSTERTLAKFLGFAAANGLWLCALSLFFFEYLTMESRLALTILILLAVAGGAATYASYPAGYAVFVAFAIPPTAFQWGRYGGESAAIIAITLAIFGVTMVSFSRYLAAVFERSVDIRFDREQVVKELRAEKLETERERKKAEEASLAKSRFLANASHDLRQPAQALALYTAVLQRSARTVDQIELASSISQASRALAGLLNNLLDLSRLDAGAVTAKPEGVDLRRLVARLGSEMTQVAAQRSIVVTHECPALMIRTDPILLERAVRNLLDNAIKFTDEGSVSVVARSDRHTVTIEVSDTGCGIPAEHHERIFDEFYQVDNAERDREKGLGLGLSIVARLAALLDGKVELTSSAAGGSTFTLRLPFTGQASPIPEGNTAGLNAPELAGVQVLVIDDDPMVRLALRALLREWGAEVDAVDSSAEALRLVDQRDWSLCLCDLRLRGSEDGLVVAQVLRSMLPLMPIVFISGDTAPERIELATKSGHALLHKPVDAESLAKSISEILEHAQSPSANHI